MRVIKTAGEALVDAGLGNEALPYILADHEREPNRWEHLCNLGIAYRIIGDLGKAKGAYMRAIELNSQSPELWNNLGRLMEDEGEFGEAEDAIGRAFGLQQSRPIALALATQMMRRGEWSKASNLWEYGREGNSWTPIHGIPAWRGESVNGKNFLAIFEGGYGDGFMALPWMKELHERGAKVTLVVWDEVTELMERCDFIDKVLPRSKSFDGRGFDFHAPLLSLPFRLHPDPAKVEPTDRIFDPPESNVRRMRESVAEGVKPKVGLCWWAEENKIARKFRTVDVNELWPLRHLDCRWINLTLEKAPDWVETKPLKSWSDTAAMISQLDAVVTVDTAVAHLAGCLGVKTWVILPLNSDWKWGIGSERSWWYDSVEVVRNTHCFSFEPAIEKVICKLHDWMEAR